MSRIVLTVVMKNRDIYLSNTHLFLHCSRIKHHTSKYKTFSKTLFLFLTSLIRLNANAEYQLPFRN